jgi:pre-mRNA-splicing factor 38A
MFTNYWNLSSKTTGNSVNEIWVITAIFTKGNLGLTSFTGGYSLVFMDEFIYNLLNEERVCDIIMPRLAKRQVLEENGDIGPRKSRLLAAMEGESDEGDNKSNGSRDSSISRSTQSRRRPSKSHSRTPSDTGSRYVSRSPSRSISRSPSPSHGTSDCPMDVDTEYHNN